MAPEVVNTIPADPLKRLSWVLVATLIIFTPLIWNALTGLGYIEDLKNRQLRIEELCGAILHADEGLTMSAHMAVATEDLSWAGYREFEPQLVEALHEVTLLALSPGADLLIAKVMESNTTLAEMENNLFDFLRQGRLSEASAILSSPGYTEQKRVYAAGMADLSIALRQSVRQAMKSAILRIKIIVMIAVTVLLFLLVGWFMALRMMSRWKLVLTESNDRLTRGAEELEHLYSSAPVGLQLLDRNFRVIRVNQHLADINGKSIPDHIGRTLREIIPQFAATIEALVEQVFVTGEPVLNIEVHGNTPADPTHERDWLVNYYPVKSPDGIPRFVGCAVLEVTALKKVELEFRRQKELLQSIIDHIPSAVFWKDRNSVHMGGNQIAATDLGFASPAEMIGKNNFDLMVTPSEAESYTQYDRQVMESGIPLVNLEEVLTKPDGRQLDVLTSKVPLRSADGEIFGVLVVYHDISSRKQVELAIADRVRLASVVADVGIALTQEDTLAGILQRCAEALVRHLDAAFARIWTLDETAQVLELQASAGLYTHRDGAHARIPVGKFKIGLIAQQRKPHLTNDVINDPRVSDHEWAQREGMVAFAGYPLVVGGKLFGVMAMFARSPLSSTTLDALATVADEMALGVARIQDQDLLRGNEARIRIQQTSLVTLTRTDLQQAGDVATQLHAITESSATALGVDRVSVWRFTPDRAAIRCVDLYDAHADEHSAGAELLAASYPAYFQALVSLDVLDAGDAQTDPRTREFSAGYLKPLGIGAMLDAPIHLSGKIEGVVCHEYVGPPRHWSADEKTYVVAIANIVSLALEGAERRRVEEELRAQTAFLQAQTESTIDALLVVDNQRKIVLQNQQFKRLWNLPVQEPEHTDLNTTLQVIADSLKDPQDILKRARYLYTHPTEIARGEVELKDGRTLERYSAPVLGMDGHYYGRFWSFRDITNRKLAEQALAERAELAESESQLDELANAMPQMVWTARPDGFVDYYNDRWYEYTGQPRGIGGDDSWKSVIHPDDLQECIDKWYACVHSGDNFQIELRFRAAKTGSYRWYLIRAMPVQGDSGKIVRWIGTCTDIDDQKQAEQHFRESEEQFHTLGDSMSQLAWMGRADGQLFWCNKRWYDYTGTNLQQMEGTGWRTVIDPQQLPTVIARRNASLAKGQPFDMVINIRGADEAYRPFLTRIVPSYGPEGHIFQWFGTATDITEQLQLEEALRRAHQELEVRVQQRTVELWHTAEELRRNEQRYRSLVDATTAVAWSTAASGEVESDMPAWATFTGQTQDQIRGHGWLAAIHPEDRAFTQEAWTAASATHETYRVEHRVRRYDGEYRNMVACAVPIQDKEGAIIEWVGAHTDVTLQRLAESALREAKEAAESANRAKSEFLANMSHEIRTPMNGILGMTELTLDSDLTREQRENLGMVKSAADSLLHLINDILDFSKIEAGRFELDPTPFALRDSLGATFRALGPQAHKKGLELTCHITADVPDMLIGDALRLRQIITNLVANAIKFTAHGEIAVRVGRKLDAEEPGWLHVTVRDTGIGIPANKLKDIFEAFTQADGSTTRRYGGTGLGLAISAQLVSLMGGQVWVESEVGTGSTFHFTAHLEEHTGAPQKLLTSPQNLEQLPVLVVDDNATNRAILEDVLSNWRMCPTAVSDGVTAIATMKGAVAAGHPFKLVVLDACMPEQDGFDVAEQIKQDPAIANATIMMLSSADSTADAARCRELGVASYLRKPITQSDLFDAIITALSDKPLEPAASAVDVPVVEAPSPRPLRILLAEDNEMNRKLAVKILQKRGHTVLAAGDGKEALAMLEQQSVDLVLMDIQMPTMDGFAATAAIRQREKTTGAHVPIVALTAHAMQGYRERCLAAGMDDYVTKPLRADELFRVLARLFPLDGAASSNTENNMVSSSAVWPATMPAFDRDSILSRVDGDRALLLELIKLFFTQTTELLPQIRSAGLRGDAEELARAAHKLKGSMGTFGAQPAVSAAQRLETMGQNDQLAGAEEALAILEKEVARLRDALDTFTREDSSCAS